MLAVTLLDLPNHRRDRRCVDTSRLHQCDGALHVVGIHGIEELVDLFDRLPFSLRVTHDEERGRLDLYCTMVFVFIFIGVIGVARFWLTYWGYTIAVAVISALATTFSYRAAVASARAYGSTLEVIARKYAEKSTEIAG